MTEQFAGTTENAFLYKELANRDAQIAELQQAVQKAEAELQGLGALCVENDQRTERLEFRSIWLERDLKETQDANAELRAGRDGWQSRAEAAEARVKELETLLEAGARW